VIKRRVVPPVVYKVVQLSMASLNQVGLMGAQADQRQYIGPAKGNAIPYLPFLRRFDAYAAPHAHWVAAKARSSRQRKEASTKRERARAQHGHCAQKRRTERVRLMTPPVERSNLPNANLPLYAYFRQQRGSCWFQFTTSLCCGGAAVSPRSYGCLQSRTVSARKKPCSQET
jgi:hypothetical protein